MSRSVHANHTTMIDTGSTTFATFIKITRKDGIIKAYTDTDTEVTISAVVYKPGASFKRTAVPSKSNIGINAFTLEGPLVASEISEDDVLAGRYDNAVVEVFMANYEAPADTPIQMSTGWLGESTRKDYQWTAEVRGLNQILENQILSLASSTCRSDFGNTGKGPGRGCRIPLTPLTWADEVAKVTEPAATFPQNGPGISDEVIPTTPNGWQYRCIVAGITDSSEPTWPTTIGATIVDGTVTWETRRALTRTAVVTVATDRATFDVNTILGDLTAGTGGSETLGFFVEGKVKATSGANIGISRTVLDFVVNGGDWTVTVTPDFPFDFAVADAVTLTAGCDKTQAVCKNNHDNITNRRAEDYIPGVAAFQVFRHD